MILTLGTNLFDFFLIPTIRIEKGRYSEYSRITLEWLNFYIGFTINTIIWDRKEK